MERVSDLGVNCPVCGKPDWCLVAKDGTAAICARVPEGSIKQCGSAGWLHVFDQNKFVPMEHKVPPPPPLNWYKIWTVATPQARNWWVVTWFARNIGVRPETLRRYFVGVGPSYELYIPLWDHCGVVGLQRRYQDGKKRQFKGSRDGLFLPMYFTVPRLLVCEGFSDTVAADEKLGREWTCVGRLSCTMGTRPLLNLAKQTRIGSILIMADRDKNGAGWRGGLNLAEKLREAGKRVCLVMPPAPYKDLRQWFRSERDPVESFYQQLRKRVVTA